MDEHELGPIWYGHHHRHMGIIGRRPPGKGDVIRSGVVWCIVGAVLGLTVPRPASLAAVLDLVWHLALIYTMALGLVGGLVGMSIPGNTWVNRLGLGVVLAGGFSICGLLVGVLSGVLFGGIGAVLVWAAGPWSEGPTAGIIGAGLGGLFGVGKALMAARGYRKERDMAEADWLVCADPEPMLSFLRGRASGRKLRLFACACVRQVLHLCTEARSRESVEVSERFADGLASDEELWSAAIAARKVNAAAARAVWPAGDGSRPLAWAALAALAAVEVAERAAAQDAVKVRQDAVVPAMQAAGVQQRQMQCALLRDLFGTPHRPAALDPAWRQWNDGCVVKLARSIYEEQRFDDLPVLADALEEAGCTDPDILGHLRGLGPHVPGCWVLDIILAKDR